MFFGGGESDGLPGVVAQGSGSGEEWDDELACVEIEAREAQGGRWSFVDDMEFGRKESVSWVDLGLAAVDGAVDRVAARIVRWTDDGGRDEELVLPLVKGKLD